MNQVKLLRELRYRERTMKDFEELRKLCCADIPGAIEVSAASNGIEKNVKRGTSFVAPGGKDNILKLKKKKEVLCENSASVIEGQNGDSSEGMRPDMEKRGQKNFTLKKKKAVFEKRQAKPYLEEGCITKPGKISDEEKVKSKTKCIGGITKTNKTIPTLSDSQYEKLFQSVIDKSLEECIASSKKLMHKVKSLQENSEMMLVSENTVPSEPLVTKGNEDVETQGVRKTKTKSKDKKVNKLSRKNKILTNTSEINEVNREGRKHKRKGQPKKIVQDYTKFIDDDEETTLEFSNQPSPSFIATSKSDTTRGSRSMEPSRGDSSHNMPAGNSDPRATPAAMKEYLPKEEEESVQDSPAQNDSRSLSRGTREVGQYRNAVFGCQQPEGEVEEVLASKFLELQQEGFHILHRDLMQLQETLGEGINSFSRKLGKRLVRLSNQMSVLVELLRNVNTALVPSPSVQISVACQTANKEVPDPSGTMSTLTSATEQAELEAINSRVPATPLLSATLRKRRSSVTTRSVEKPSKVVRVDNYVAWVQCSRKKCGKWRRLEDNVDPATLPQDWICSQNPDPLYNMCDLPEEVWDGRENDIIYAELVPGSIVWAKQLGYPWWPGMVEHDPQTGKYFMFTSDSDQFPSKYHVTFFDTTVSHAWIPVPLIKSFQEIPLEKNISKRDFTKRINAGKKMAEEAQKVKIQDRLSHFGFVVRYKGNGDAELSEDNSSQESMETPCNVKDSNRPKSRKKEDIWSEDSAEKEPIVTETHQQKARKDKGINHINADPKRRRKQESPVQLVRKAFPTRSKLFRDPTVKRSSTGNNRKAAEKTAVSNGIKEPELGVLKPKVTDDKTAGHDHVKSNSCLNPDLLSMELSVATDMNVEERSMEQKVLYKDPMTPRRDGLNNEDFTQLLQEVMENKQDADMFSDDDMAILTLKKSEEEEEFAEFMFEE